MTFTGRLFNFCITLFMFCFVAVIYIPCKILCYLADFYNWFYEHK